MIDIVRFHQALHSKGTMLYACVALLLFINELGQLGKPIEFLGLTFQGIDNADITFCLVMVIAYNSISLMLLKSRVSSAESYQKAKIEIEKAAQASRSLNLEETTAQQFSKLGSSCPKKDDQSQRRTVQEIFDNSEQEYRGAEMRYYWFHVDLPLFLALGTVILYGYTSWRVLGSLVSKAIAET